MEGMIDEPRMMVVIIDPPVHQAGNMRKTDFGKVADQFPNGKSMDFPHYFIQVRLIPSFFAAETKSRGTKRPNAGRAAKPPLCHQPRGWELPGVYA